MQNRQRRVRLFPTIPDIRLFHVQTLYRFPRRIGVLDHARCRCGLGNTDFDLAAPQPVSVLLDDVVMANVTLNSFPIFDVAGVEVLSGPQGTLFGQVSYQLTDTLRATGGIR